MWRSAIVALLVSGCGDPAGVRYEIPPRPEVDCDPADNGGACRRDADCAPALCARDPGVPPLDLSTVVLACRSPGAGGAPGSRCASASGCVHGLCASGGTCVAPCATDADCAAGASCRGVHVRVEGSAFESARACIPWATLPDDVSLIRGSIDATDWSRGTVTIDIAPGRSQTIILPTCGARALAVRLLSKDPYTLFDYGTAFEGAAQATFIEERSNPINVLLPNGGTPTSDFGYALTLQTEGEGGADFWSLSRVRAGTRFDIDVFYVTDRLSPEGTRGPPSVAGALDYLEARLAPSGISIGEVRQHEITGGLRERFSVLTTGLRPGEEDERGPLFALSAGAVGPSLPIFFVRSVVGALGRSGGIPGPSGAHGTAGSGIVIGPELIDSQALLERAVAHEALHFLGLFHTTEATFFVKDGIDDTPVCTRDRDVDGDGFASPEECADSGSENLMFWSASGDTLTEGQAEVVRGTYVAR